jgi:tripartite ATP-independent transporter DctP family solute receptor
MKRITVMLLLVCLTAGFAFAGGQGDGASDAGKGTDVIKMTMATSQPPEGGFMGEMPFKLAEYLKEESGGRIELTVHHSGSLSSNERELLEMAQAGTVDFAMGATTYVLGWSDSFKIFDLPFLFDSVDHFDRVVFGEVGDILREECLDDNVVLLGQIIPGFRSIFTAKKEIRGIDDLKGLKIRSMESPVYVEMFKRLGMLPTPMPSSELYTSLQTGVVDAGENDPASVVSWGWIDVIKYYMLNRHTLSSNALFIGKARFDSLSPDLQDAVMRASERAVRYQFDYIQGAWEDSMKKIRDKGITVVELSDAELKKFRDRVAPMVDEYALEIRNNLVQKVIDAR